jgi:hypothetical protein
MSIRSEAIRAVETLQTMVEEEYISGYDIAKMMSDELASEIEGGLHALAQEKDHWSEAQMLTESEYYDNLYAEHVPDLKDKSLQDIQEKYNETD